MAPRKYPQELWDAAMRLVSEAGEEDPGLSLNAAGTTTTDAKRIRELEHEVQERKRANEILLAASSFFARELD